VLVRTSEIFSQKQNGNQLGAENIAPFDQEEYMYLKCMILQKRFSIGEQSVMKPGYFSMIQGNNENLWAG
jgi:hypothetical protein